jgi:hypothetical protein
MSLMRVPCLLPAGQSLSQGADCGGNGRIIRISMPQDWTPAPITFQLSPDDTTYRDLYHTTPDQFSIFEVSVSAVPGAVVVLPASMGGGISWLKIRSGTRTVPVAQAADRQFTITLDAPDAVAGGAPGPAGPVGPAGPIGPAGPQGIHGDPAAPALLQTVVLGHAKGVNYNVIGDTAIAIAAAKYAITQLVTFNNVGGADNYTGSLRDAPNGAGTDLGGYAYNTNGQLGDWSDFPGPLPVIANPMLYFHIGTKEGAPATGDLYVMGYDLTGL